MQIKDLKILFYDIETTPLKAYVWRTGEQRVTSSLLVKGSDIYDIICICYSWGNSKKIESLDWGKSQNSKNMITKFARIIDEADIVIGKNNSRFDDKYITTLMQRYKIPAIANWPEKSDDLERQLRRHFYLPSFKLDYVSQIEGLDGKNHMSFDDWEQIIVHKSDKHLNKMVKYCKKDVSDTKIIWDRYKSYFKPKHNLGKLLSDLLCKICGSKDVKKNGKRSTGIDKKDQFYFCNSHGGYAGKTRITITAKGDIKESDILI